MSFDSRYKPGVPQVCPVCRQKYSDGRAFDHAAYNIAGEHICKSCFKAGYQNRAEGRTAALTDDTANPLTKFRPAQIMERPRFRKSSEAPAMGYEYSMAYLSEGRIIRDTLVLVSFCILAKLAYIWLSGTQTGVSISNVAVSLVLCLVSAAAAIVDLIRLIRGLLLGMGHLRRILLAVSIAVFVLLALILRPDHLLFI